MNISDQGIIISSKAFQETSAILTVFTRENGLQSGIANNIKSSKNAHIYLAGNFVDFNWNARLAHHMGSVKCELIKAYGAKIMHSKLRLYATNSILSLIQVALKPHEKYSALFDVFHQYVARGEFSFLDYIKTELFILQEIGYSLDLSVCASTGTTENLIYVSPKSGKAVSAEAGKPYDDMMLKLPQFLHLEEETLCPMQARDALNLTGYFFRRHVFMGGKETIAREMFREAVTKS
jgi:DNA repair protein RecO (recombination protein O)